MNENNFLCSMNKILSILLLLCVLVSCKKSNEEVSTPPPAVTAFPPVDIGNGWTKYYINITNSGIINDLHAKDSNTVYVAFNTMLCKSVDGGVTWKNMNVNNGFTKIHVTPNGNLFGCTKLNGDLYKVTEANVITRVLQDSCSDVFFLDNNIGYAISKKHLYKTTNGGASWAIEYSDNFYEKSVIHILSEQVGFIASYNKIYAKTNNQWGPYRSITGPPSNDEIYTLFALSTTNYYVGFNVGILFQYTNNMSTPFTAVRDITGLVLSKCWSVYFTDPLNGYCAPGSDVHKTTDGGLRWEKIVFTKSIGTPYFIHFFDKNNGWVTVGDDNEPKAVLRYKNIL
jgi:hypothetical protein